MAPSITPSVTPSNFPSYMPSNDPSGSPSVVKSETPSIIPSIFPSVTPSLVPSNIPSFYLDHSTAVLTSVITFSERNFTSTMRDDIIPTYLSVVHTFTNILETGGNVRNITFTEQSPKTTSHLYAQNLIVVTDLYFSADEIDDDILEVFSRECDEQINILVEMLEEEIPDFIFPGFSSDISFISAMSSTPSATETLVSEQAISALAAAVSTYQNIFSLPRAGLQ